MNTNLIMNALQYFFAKKYSNAVASDYLSQGKLQKSEIGFDFILQFKTYHFDKDLNLKNVTIWQAVNVHKEMMIKNLVMSLKIGLITYSDFLRLYLQIEDDNV